MRGSLWLLARLAGLAVGVGGAHRFGLLVVGGDVVGFDRRGADVVGVGPSRSMHGEHVGADGFLGLLWAPDVDPVGPGRLGRVVGAVEGDDDRAVEASVVDDRGDGLHVLVADRPRGEHVHQEALPVPVG
ncbi:hypothetical protein BRD56_13050 [Thermoplasmatales archaeon SW_10_69_26]|nr:MAG: hypothetical protein BRD56_13050 [Thermoplasmatales archaeon SW_10_69_26]